MDHWNNFYKSFSESMMELGLFFKELKPYDSLEEFRDARRKSRDEALKSDDPHAQLMARIMTEEAWWDPTVPS